MNLHLFVSHTLKWLWFFTFGTRTERKLLAGLEIWYWRDAWLQEWTHAWDTEFWFGLEFHHLLLIVLHDNISIVKAFVYLSMLILFHVRKIIRLPVHKILYGQNLSWLLFYREVGKVQFFVLIAIHIVDVDFRCTIRIASLIKHQFIEDFVALQILVLLRLLLVFCFLNLTFLYFFFRRKIICNRFYYRFLCRFIGP